MFDIYHYLKYIFYSCILSRIIESTVSKTHRCSAALNEMRKELNCKSWAKGYSLIMQTTTVGVENCTKKDFPSRSDPLSKTNLFYRYVLSFLKEATITITSDV